MRALPRLSRLYSTGRPRRPASVCPPGQQPGTRVSGAGAPGPALGEGARREGQAGPNARPLSTAGPPAQQRRLRGPAGKRAPPQGRAGAAADSTAAARVSPTGSPATETTPATATASTALIPSTGLGSPTTPTGPMQTPSLPATASSSTQAGTAPTTRTQPTVSSEGKAQAEAQRCVRKHPGCVGGAEGDTRHRPCRVTLEHLCCHHPGHICTGPHSHAKVHSHGPSRDLGHHAAHGALPQHRHAVHSSGHGAHHSSLAKPGNIRDRHRECLTKPGNVGDRHREPRK